MWQEIGIEAALAAEQRTIRAVPPGVHENDSSVDAILAFLLKHGLVDKETTLVQFRGSLAENLRLTKHYYTRLDKKVLHPESWKKEYLKMWLYV